MASDQLNNLLKNREKLREAVADDILSERSMKYKRNLYIVAVLSIAIWHGKITKNTVTFSGVSFEIQNAETVITYALGCLLVYFSVSFFRRANGELKIWKTKITDIFSFWFMDMSTPLIIQNKKNSEPEFRVEKIIDAIDVTKFYPLSNSVTALISIDIYNETSKRINYFNWIEYRLPILISLIALATLTINLTSLLGIQTDPPPATTKTTTTQPLPTILDPRFRWNDIGKRERR